jgi:hypothetical protein
MTNEGTKARGRRFEASMMEGGVARVVITDDEPFDGEDAHHLLEVLGEISDGRCVPMLADLRRLRTVTAEARKVMASERAGARIAAAAAVVSNPLNRMIGQFFLRLNHPPFELRLFDEYGEAVLWARRFGDNEVEG